MAKLYETLPDVIGQIGDTVGSVASLVTALRGRNAEKEIPTLAPAGEAAALARALAAASADPNSPMFRNLAALFEERSRREATQRTIADVLMRRRARARGNMGGAVISDRRDEQRSRNLALLFMKAREDARIAARDYLSQASTNAANASAAYSRTFAPYAATANSSRGEKYDAYGALGDLASSIGNLGSIFMNRPTTVQPVQLTAPGELRPVPVQTAPLGLPSYEQWGP